MAAAAGAPYVARVHTLPPAAGDVPSFGERLGDVFLALVLAPPVSALVTLGGMFVVGESLAALASMGAAALVTTGWLAVPRVARHDGVALLYLLGAAGACALASGSLALLAHIVVPALVTGWVFAWALLRLGSPPAAGRRLAARLGAVTAALALATLLAGGWVGRAAWALGHGDTSSWEVGRIARLERPRVLPSPARSDTVVAVFLVRPWRAHEVRAAAAGGPVQVGWDEETAGRSDFGGGKLVPLVEGAAGRALVRAAVHDAFVREVALLVPGVPVMHAFARAIPTPALPMGWTRWAVVRR